MVARVAAAEWFLRYLAADLIADELRLGKRGEGAFHAGRMFARRARQALARSEPLLVESPLSGLAMRRFIRRARASGYRVSVGLVYVGSAEVCIRRIRARAEAGGHSVPDADVRRRFRRSLVNFWELYRFDADAWHLTHNGGREAVSVAFGEGSRGVVTESTYFERFLGLLKR